MNKIERSATLVPAVGAQVDQGVRPLPTSAAVAIIYPRDVPHVDVLSWRKRPKTAGEYLLYTEDQVADAVAADRERWRRIAEAAQAVTTGCDDKIDHFELPSHLMAALALALDEGPNAKAHLHATAREQTK